MEDVEIKGIELLNDGEKWELNKEIEIYRGKIKWKTKSDFVLKIVIKEYSKKAEDKDNKRKRYSLQAQIKGETSMLEASAVDWDFHKAVHSLFEKLITEAEHHYHSSEQRSSSQRKV